MPSATEISSNPAVASILQECPFDIRESGPTEDGQFGVFATRDIRKGELLIAEKPALILPFPNIELAILF